MPLIMQTRRKAADMASIQAFAELSNDYNPLHVDREFAAKTPFGALIAHGPMSTGLLLTSIADSLSPDEISGMTLTLKFIRPVREDDIVTARSSEGESMEVERLLVENQNGETVIDGTLVAPNRRKA